MRQVQNAKRGFNQYAEAGIGNLRKVFDQQQQRQSTAHIDMTMQQVFMLPHFFLSSLHPQSP
jgi:hypothetical protein